MAELQAKRAFEADLQEEDRKKSKHEKKEWRKKGKKDKKERKGREKSKGNEGKGSRAPECGRKRRFEAIARPEADTKATNYLMQRDNKPSTQGSKHASSYLKLAGTSARTRQRRIIDWLGMLRFPHASSNLPPSRCKQTHFHEFQFYISEAFGQQNNSWVQLGRRHQTEIHYPTGMQTTTFERTMLETPTSYESECRSPRQDIGLGAFQWWPFSRWSITPPPTPTWRVKEKEKANDPQVSECKTTCTTCTSSRGHPFSHRVGNTAQAAYTGLSKKRRLKR